MPFVGLPNYGSLLLLLGFLLLKCLYRLRFSNTARVHATTLGFLGPWVLSVLLLFVKGNQDRTYAILQIYYEYLVTFAFKFYLFSQTKKKLEFVDVHH